LLLGIAETPVAYHIPRTNRVLLDILSQPRGVLNVSRTAFAALFANLGERLDNLHMRSLATAHLASGIRSNACNGRMLGQCTQFKPTPSPTITVRASHNKPECANFLKRWNFGWLRWFHESR
tara:strand:+ start:12998 stop:13363 length:366 start_codon:yes stop_codon:yes gene_type:complete